MSTQLLRKVGPAVQRTVARVLGSQHPELDDTTQEALLAFVAAWGAFRGECHPAGYAARIAAREAIRARRRERARRRRVADLAEHSLTTEPTTDEQADPLRLALLVDLLAEIPPAQRQALVQRSVLELSLEEVARASGAPVNTVRSRLRLAREAMQSLILACPGLADEAERGART